MPVAKRVKKPSWWLNTYFWIAGILFLVSVIGLIKGDPAIRDPGQKRESLLWLLYLIAAAASLANGFVSHKQTVRAYEEANSESS